MKPVHRKLRAAQRQLTLADGVDAELALLSDRARPTQAALVEAIRQHRAGFSVSGTGRVFNGLTGLSRQLRPFVRLAGEPIRGVDLVSRAAGATWAHIPPFRTKRCANM